MDRRLGRPLPHQLPNPTRADPLAINLSSVELIRHYSRFPRAIPNQRARSHALLTRPPLIPKDPLDLHVLGLPPAFVLSQDQTLKLKRVMFALPLRYLSATAHEDPSLTSEPLHIVRPSRSRTKRHRLSCIVPLAGSRWPTNGEADTHIIGKKPNGPTCKRPSVDLDQTARISLHRITLSKSPGQQKRLASCSDAARLALPDFAAALRAKRLRPSR